MMIVRDSYLVKIRKLMGNGLVKIITGIRRCGKSYFLFQIFREYLLSNDVDEGRIVEVHLDEDDFEALRDPRRLSAYVKERIRKDGSTTYVLIDEIQECKPAKGDTITFYDVLSSLSREAMNGRRWMKTGLSMWESFRLCLTRALWDFEEGI